MVKERETTVHTMEFDRELSAVTLTHMLRRSVIKNMPSLPMLSDYLYPPD
jgi:hypothetical protein